MSADQQIRSLLDSDGELLGPPQVERELERIVGRARRSRRRRVAAGSLALAGAAAAAVVAVQTAGWDRPSAEDPVASPVSPLVGEYVVEVPAQAGAGRAGLAGRWVVRVGADGEVALTPPRSVTAGVATATMTIEGGRVRTNALGDLPGCQAGTGIGTYRWSATVDAVVFELVRKDCASRMLLFAGSTWTRLS